MWPLQPILTWLEILLLVSLRWPNQAMTGNKPGTWLEWRAWGLSTPHSCGNWSIYYLSRRDFTGFPLQLLLHAPCTITTPMRIWTMPFMFVSRTDHETGAWRRWIPSCLVHCCFLLAIWERRSANQRIRCYEIRAEIEGKIALLRDTSFKEYV